MGKTRQKFHVTLKPNVELKRQRSSKVPLHLKEKLEKLLTQLKDADIIREMGDDDKMGSLFVNPIILMPKNDYVKLVIDARYLNSVTDLLNYSWPLEPVQMIMTRVNGKVFSVSDLSCAYHQVPLSPETQKLTFHNRWKTVNSHTWIFWVMWTAKLLQLTNENTFRPSH